MFCHLLLLRQLVLLLLHKRKRRERVQRGPEPETVAIYFVEESGPLLPLQLLSPGVHWQRNGVRVDWFDRTLYRAGRLRSQRLGEVVLAHFASCEFGVV